MALRKQSGFILYILLCDLVFSVKDILGRPSVAAPVAFAPSF